MFAVARDVLYKCYFPQKNFLIVLEFTFCVNPSLIQVDLNLALGTLLKNPMFEEAEAEFQQLASFATRFSLRNALQVNYRSKQVVGWVELFTVKAHFNCITFA